MAARCPQVEQYNSVSIHTGRTDASRCVQLARISSFSESSRSMSGSGGAAPPTAVLGSRGMALGSLKGQQRSRVAGGGAAGRSPMRLPSLAAAAKAPRSPARLSVSEPSLLTLNDHIILEGFSAKRCASAFQKRPPPPAPFCRSVGHDANPRPSRGKQQNQQPQPQPQGRAAYIHFSKAIQPSFKAGPARRHSYNPALLSERPHGDLQPLSTQIRGPRCQAEPLSVIGKPCLLRGGQRPAAGAGGPGRTQLHVFLPTEAEGEEADSESVDEGFMDELDSKIGSLRLQREGQEAATERQKPD